MNVNMNVKSAQCLKHYLTNKHDFIQKEKSLLGNTIHFINFLNWVFQN